MFCLFYIILRTTDYKKKYKKKLPDFMWEVSVRVNFSINVYLFYILLRTDFLFFKLPPNFV